MCKIKEYKARHTTGQKLARDQQLPWCLPQWQEVHGLGSLQDVQLHTHHSLVIIINLWTKWLNLQQLTAIIILNLIRSTTHKGSGRYQPSLVRCQPSPVHCFLLWRCFHYLEMTLGHCCLSCRCFLLDQMTLLHYFFWSCFSHCQVYMASVCLLPPAVGHLWNLLAAVVAEFSQWWHAAGCFNSKQNSCRQEVSDRAVSSVVGLLMVWWPELLCIWQIFASQIFSPFLKTFEKSLMESTSWLELYLNQTWSTSKCVYCLWTTARWIAPCLAWP